MTTSLRHAPASLPTGDDSPVGDLVLQVACTERNGQVVRVRAGRCTIGSRADCTVRLRSRGVRPVHCVILRGPGGAFIRRWSADTRLNGYTFTDAPLKAGDRLSIGPLEFQVLECGVPPSDTLASEKPLPPFAASAASAENFPPPAFDLERLQLQWNDERRALHDDLAHLRQLNMGLQDESQVLRQTSEHMQGECERQQAQLAALAGQLQTLATERQTQFEFTQRLEHELAELRQAAQAQLASSCEAEQSLDIERTSREQEQEQLAQRLRELQTHCEELTRQLATEANLKRETQAAREASLAAQRLEFEGLSQQLSASREAARLAAETLSQERVQREEESARLQERIEQLENAFQEAAEATDDEYAEELPSETSPHNLLDELTENSHEAQFQTERSNDESACHAGPQAWENRTLSHAPANETYHPTGTSFGQFQAENVEEDCNPGVQIEPEAEDTADDANATPGRERIAASALDVLARYGRYPEQAPSNLFGHSQEEPRGYTPPTSLLAGGVAEDDAALSEFPPPNDNAPNLGYSASRPEESSPLATSREPEPTSRLGQRASGPALPHSHNAAAGGDDDSIESYMARLLNRVRSGADQPHRAEATAPAVAISPSSPEREGREVFSSSTNEAELPVEMLNSTTFVPRAAAPERMQSLAAMREVANLSTHAALRTHSKGLWLRLVAEKFLVAGASFVCGIGLLGQFTERTLTTTCGGGIALVVGIVWTALGFRLVVQGPPARAKQATEVPPSGQPQEAPPKVLLAPLPK